MGRDRPAGGGRCDRHPAGAGTVPGDGGAQPVGLRRRRRPPVAAEFRDAAARLALLPGGRQHVPGRGRRHGAELPARVHARLDRLAHRPAVAAHLRSAQPGAVLPLALCGRDRVDLSRGAQQRHVAALARRTRHPARLHPHLQHRRRDLGARAVLHALCLSVRDRADAANGCRARGRRARARRVFLGDLAVRDRSAADAVAAFGSLGRVRDQRRLVRRAARARRNPRHPHHADRDLSSRPVPHGFWPRRRLRRRGDGGDDPARHSAAAVSRPPPLRYREREGLSPAADPSALARQARGLRDRGAVPRRRRRAADARGADGGVVDDLDRPLQSGGADLAQLRLRDLRLQAHPAGHPQQPVPGARRRHRGRGAGAAAVLLPQPQHLAAAPPGRCGAVAAARHPRHHPGAGLSPHRHPHAALQHLDHHPDRLHRALLSIRDPHGLRPAAWDQSRARAERAGERRELAADHALRAAAAAHAGHHRRLADAVRDLHPRARGYHPALCPGDRDHQRGARDPERAQRGQHDRAGSRPAGAAARRLRILPPYARITGAGLTGRGRFRQSRQAAQALRWADSRRRRLVRGG